METNENAEFTVYKASSGWVVWDHVNDGQLTVDGLTEAQAREVLDDLTR
jgi:hypothetical protein